ncbi:uncharacterized protein [Coffea arabica]|uniref:Uncharacterized protein n=1 Tax=Coffea arabica TaxID=13443 RepID=A0A6P6TYG5_COFAR|nr:selenoprotein H-like [Coffea arabica]
MAPRKKTTVEPSTRVTRSSTRQAEPIPETPKKRAKTIPENPKKKKAKLVPSKPKQEAEKAEETKGDVVDGSKKTIIVEHCKQCNSFKTRALQVKDGLEKGLDGGVNVILNPEKPRRGCFEIREEGENGEKFISLLEMKRPFTPMKALDMDKVVSDILEKIKG